MECACRGVRNGHLMLCVGLQAVHYMSGMCSFAVRAVCSRGQSLQYCGPSHLCSACHDYPASTPSLHLCLQNAATWRNRPRLPSKACKLTAALATKAQCCGPSRLCSACHGYPASTPSQGIKMHEGSTNPRLKQELRSATGLALRATEVTAMSTFVVQECHLWLSLAERSDIDKACFLDALVSQAGLFNDTVEDCVQQFSAVQKQTEAIQHILPQT